MNRVSIINFNLHKRVVIQDHKDFITEEGFNKSTTKGRLKSPEQTIKKLVKKGLFHYTNPFSRSKTGLLKDKQNSGVKQMRQSNTKTSMCKTLQLRNSHSSSSVFMCARNHQTGQRNQSQNNRVKTQSRQNSDSYSSYIHKKKHQTDWDDMQGSNFAFRQFKNISEQTMNRINVQNERRNFMLTQVQKTKYDQLWKKHLVPAIIKQKQVTLFGSRLMK